MHASEKEASEKVRTKRDEQSKPKARAMYRARSCKKRDKEARDPNKEKNRSGEQKLKKSK